MFRFILIASGLVLSLSAAAADRPMRVAMYSGSAEYKSKDSLDSFAKLLTKNYNCQCTVYEVEEKGTTLNGIEGLETADVVIFFTRRVKLSDDQLDKVRKFVASGKGIVGVRTASHGFQTWLEFDPQVIGGSYNNHYGKEMLAQVSINPKAKEHPILSGVAAFTTKGKLYKNPKLAEDVTLLLSAKTGDYQEPVAWVRESKPGERGRVFYTSLGTEDDFKDANFQRLLTNAVQWANEK